MHERKHHDIAARFWRGDGGRHVDTARVYHPELLIPNLDSALYKAPRRTLDRLQAQRTRRTFYFSRAI
jgi:hypothetical protein